MSPVYTLLTSNFKLQTANGKPRLAVAGTWPAACRYVEHADWTIVEKPFDLRERLFLFACLIVRVVQYLHTRGPIGAALSYQILKSGTSAGSNYEEADGGSSPRDKLAKRKIVLRELKETRFRLSVLRQTGYLSTEHDPVLQETTELVKIVAKIIRNSDPGADR